MTDHRSRKPGRVGAECAALMERAALYAETYLTRDRDTKRPRRIRTPQWRRAQHKPSQCVTINCRILDIDLT